MTHQGRVPTGDFRVIVDEAARRARFEPQDRAAGGLIAWPSGLAAYAYGAYFHQYLADRYGADRLTALADATAGRVPFSAHPRSRTCSDDPSVNCGTTFVTHDQSRQRRRARPIARLAD